MNRQLNLTTWVQNFFQSRAGKYSEVQNFNVYNYTKKERETAKTDLNALGYSVSFENNNNSMRVVNR